MVTVQTYMHVLIYGPPATINIARFERIFCLGPKRNFYQKVAFWVEPNAIFLQFLVIWAFSAPKSANKHTLNVLLFKVSEFTRQLMCSVDFKYQPSHN